MALEGGLLDAEVVAGQPRHNKRLGWIPFRDRQTTLHPTRFALSENIRCLGHAR